MEEVIINSLSRILCGGAMTTDEFYGSKRAFSDDITEPDSEEPEDETSEVEIAY